MRRGLRRCSRARQWLDVSPPPCGEGIGGGGIELGKAGDWEPRRTKVCSYNAPSPAVFTPPLTPPRHHAEGVSSTRREGNRSASAARRARQERMMWEELQFAFALTVSGLSIGLMYSLIALGFVLVYKATDAINFAQGEFVMLAGFVAALALAAKGMPVLAAVGIAVGGDGGVQLRAGARRAAAAARPPDHRRDHGDDRPRRHAARIAADHRGRGDASGIAEHRRHADRDRRRLAAADSDPGRRRHPGVPGSLHLVLPQEPDGRRHARRGRQPAGGDGHGDQRGALLCARLGDGRHGVGTGRRDLGQHAGRRRAPGAGGPQGVSRGDPGRARLDPGRGHRRSHRRCGGEPGSRLSRPLRGRRHQGLRALRAHDHRFDVQALRHLRHPRIERV